MLLWACEEEGQARLEDDESNWQEMRERKKSETVLKFGEMHTSHINGICLSCPLFFGEKEAHTGILRQARRYTEIAWPFSSSINMRRAICCNHAQSIASCGGEPFHILWIYPSLYTQWHQFKCKSWHSHHSAFATPALPKALPHRPRSEWAAICSTVHLICVLKCVRAGKCAANIMREKVKERKRCRALQRWCLRMQVYVMEMMLRLCTAFPSGGLFPPPIALSCPISRSNPKLDDCHQVWECVFRSLCAQRSI